MPINNDDIEQGYSPITPPEGDIEEQELSERIPVPASEPEQSSKWQWVGDTNRPEAQEHSDGISDLFTVTDDDVDAGEGVDDLVSVAVERDILDADENGDLSDLVDVTEEDIMGSEDYGQPSPRYRQRTSRRGAIRRPPPTSLGGMRV